MMKQAYFLNYDEVINRLSESPITIIDGGARGKMFKPFDQVAPEILYAYRFDPDPEAEMVESAHSKVYPKALWKTSTTIPVHIAKVPSASSVYPFNRRLQEEIDPHMEGRTVAKTLEVEALSLDSIFPNEHHTEIDFIKLDVHGCEYSVLEGAETLLDTTLGLLVENWILPIHQGQKTRAQVEQLLNSRGFYLFEQYDVAKWARKGPTFAKTQAVAVDSLYFPHCIADQKVYTDIQALKQLGICDLFGHHGYTWQLAEYFFRQGVLEEKLYHLCRTHLEHKAKAQGRIRFFQKILGRLQSRLCAFAGQ